MSAMEQMTEAQDRVLRGMESAQEQVIEMNRRVAEAMTNMLPDGDRFSAPSLPGVDNMPRPDELIDRYFDFTAKMAEANRAFYKEMVSVWSSAFDEQASGSAKASSSKQSGKAKKSAKAGKAA